VVVDPGDDDVAAEIRVREQCGRDVHPPLFVGRRLAGAGEEVTLHPPALLAQRVQRGESRVAVILPALGRPRVDAAVEAARHDDAVLERPAKLGRERETVLVIDRVLVFA
jgi:hypothetical protein